MTPATSIVWQFAGSPTLPESELCDCRCWLCGSQTVRGLSWRKWQGAQFTDQNKCSAPESSYVCEACAWCCAWNPPPGAPLPEPGKKGLNLRLFSHLYDGSGYRYLNKQSKAEIRAWLQSEHEGQWFAAISDSGQKHLLPWTPINPSSLHAGTGLVYFEERTVALGDWRLVDDMTALLTAGATKAEIADGSWSPRSFKALAAVIRDFEQRWGALRSSAWFGLAIWLAQREPISLDTAPDMP